MRLHPVRLRSAVATLVAIACIVTVATQARAQGIQFPPGIGIVNVRDFGAAGNGISDDTAALNAAFASARAPGSTAKFIYMPDGVYRVTNTVFFTESRTTLQGQSREGTIIRLDPASPGFAAPDGFGGFVSKNVLSTRESSGFSANEFVTSVFDLTVEVGSGNPGAVAVNFHCNNQGTLRDVTARALDATTGKTGLNLSGNDRGPGMIRNLVVEGFNRGIDAGGTEYSWVFENTTLRNQREYAIFNFWNILTFRGLVSENTVPVLWNDLVTQNNFPWGMATIIDGSFSVPGGGPAPTAAIRSRTSTYLRNVISTGYPSLIEQVGVNQPFTAVAGEWTSDRAFSIFNAQPAMLNLPVQDTPEVPWDPPASWASVTSFGAIPNDNIDDSAAFQAAIDSGATTVFSPIGRYLIANQIVLRGSVRRLFLTQSQIASIVPLRGSANAMFSMGTTGAPIVVVERGGFDAGTGTPPIENAGSARTLVLRNCGADDVRLSGAGTTFVEDVVGGPWTISSGHVGYFRQCNPENAGVKITNNAATLWLMGLKTEAQGTPLLTTNGGTTELIGGNIYPVQTLPLDQPLLKTENSRVSAIIGGSAYSTTAFHRVFAEETRAAATRRLFHFEVPGRVGFFIGPRVAFYAADTLNPPPAGSGPFSHYPLDETAGTIVPDIAGGPDGATNNNPAWTAGQIGNALAFDGIDDFVTLPNNRGGSGQGSISMWVRTAHDFTDQGMLFYANVSANANANGGGPDLEMHLNFNADDTVSFFIEGGTAPDLVLGSGRTLNDNAWHHVVATWDLGGFADLYVDGQRTATASNGLWADMTWQIVTRLGRPAANARYYNGIMDDVRVYTRPISHAEVNDLFDAGRGFANYPPNVTADIDQTVQDPSYTAQLNGQAVDDNQPFGPPIIQWTVTSAPPAASVTFSNPADPRATATFSAAGTYTLRLTIDDGVETRFDELTVIVYDPLPSPWDNTDQGDTAAFGWALYTTPNRFELNGSGPRIGGFPAAGCDGFHFAYVPLAGAPQNTNIVARVTTVENTNTSARAGVMFRQNLDGSCIANAFVGVTAAGEVVMTSRSGSFGGTALLASVPAVSLPVWVRIERINANLVRGFYSSNGVNWNTLADATVNTGTLSTFFGLANSAYNNGDINTATFDGVLVGPRLACIGNANDATNVDFSDITSVLANFGATYSPGTLGPGDANYDLTVNFADITSVLANFASVCP